MPSSPQLSVIVVSSRPQWLANCLSQYSRQSLGDLTTELVVVAEGERSHFDPIISRYPAKAVYKPVQGRAGAFAKDVGLSHATGDYAVFLDDDNVYYHHALTTLYATAKGYDVGIARTLHMAANFGPVPCDENVRFGNIDTMCLCIRTEMAKRIKWSDHDDRGTDYAYLTKLVNLGATVRWVDLAIGEKLEERC